VREVGTRDGEYLRHVIQTLLQRRQDLYATGVVLLVVRALRGSVPNDAIRFATAIRLVVVAGLAHRQAGPTVTLVPEEQPRTDNRLVVLAGDYLYSQAACITAELRNLAVMATLAEGIKAQCRTESARWASHTAAAGTPGLYTLCACGAGNLVGCNAARLDELAEYGGALDLISAGTDGGVREARDRSALLRSFGDSYERACLINLLDALEHQATRTVGEEWL
jgi:hypothetical protein